ncbi:follistatin-related protein 1-like isoform X2 [Synchiropus splendidus]|uniref:follistatin-related protein 1-like isoform X2 n=1 Tax=Synchiropus splendidus TaxID=270530 RepID=UPI00237D5C28|nr:follistatin-related protein 1-like isoform X2 [Synchiropus splendidus]
MLRACVLLLLLPLSWCPGSPSPVTRAAAGSLTGLAEDAQEPSVCSRTFCGAGRECVSTDRGEPVCRCLQECEEKESWVCGSNSRSYRNHCELHRDACLAQVRIHLEHQGRCPGEAPQTDASPIVCFLSDRDWLRERVIRWLREEVGPASSSSALQDALLTYFQTYDNGDSQLDSKEFLRFLKHNESALNLTFSSSQETNLLLRSLCVDALIELSDENADWTLSLPEFVNCLSPSFHPPERKCALEDEVFEDGAQAQMECNKCVCACGNWVCTALTCSGELQLQDERTDGGAAEEMTEEEWSRRVAELTAGQHNFTLET